MLVASVLKASTALAATFAVLFHPSWHQIVGNPVALSSTILAVVVTSPGATTGVCVRNSLQATLGLVTGALAFLAFANVSTPTAGFLFFCFVSVCAYVRASGVDTRPFFLVAVIFSFQGIYTTIVNQGYSSSSLVELLASYGLGLAAGIIVNLVVFPFSSEMELRETIVVSLQNISTLSHLISKTLAGDLEEDEKELRDQLTNRIRKDFSNLVLRLAESRYELLSTTKFTLKDYQSMINGVRAIQQALITSSSAVQLMSASERTMPQRLLARSDAARTFKDFRHGIDLCIEDVIKAIIPRRQPEFKINVERALPIEAEPSRLSRRRTTFPNLGRKPPVQSGLQAITERLKAEVARGGWSMSPGPGRRSGSTTPTRRESKEGHPMSPPERSSSSWDSKERASFLRKSFNQFSTLQTATVRSLIAAGTVDVGDELFLDSPQPSLQELYVDKYAGAWASNLFKSPLAPTPHAGAANPSGSPPTPVAEPKPIGNLTKAYSLLFGFSQLTEELVALHSLAQLPRKKRLHVPMLDRSIRHVPQGAEDDELQNALAKLSREPAKIPSTRHKGTVLFSYLSRIEHFLATPRSRYAIKCGLGATLYTIFLTVGSLQEFFISYGMLSSLITVIVGITPSLGQSFLTFTLQLAGTGIGNVFGLIVYEVFRTTSGYPYGYVVFLTLFAGVMSTVYHRQEAYFSFALLSMVGAGSSLLFAQIGPFPGGQQSSPPLHAAQAIAVMCISMTIAIVFQLFVFRQPARRHLRLSLAAATAALESYSKLFQLYINEVAPVSEEKAKTGVSDKVLDVVQRELIRQEFVIQEQILALMPIFEFAKIEPTWTVPFRATTILSILDSHQLILDRLREARVSSRNGFTDVVHRSFVAPLAPYRFHSQRLSRILFHLGSTSLLTKTPLPRDAPSSKPTWIAFEHDAFVLSRRMSKLDNAEEVMSSPGFISYWFYLTALHAVASELEDLEDSLSVLFAG